MTEPEAPGGLVFALYAHDGLELERIRVTVAELEAGLDPAAIALRHGDYVHAHGGYVLCIDGDTGATLSRLDPNRVAGGTTWTPEARAAFVAAFGRLPDERDG